MAQSGPRTNLVRDNVVRDANTGKVFIPASKRPDGTWRKAIQVKEGYVPQEEVPIYEPKAATQSTKTRENGPRKPLIPGAVFVEDPKTAEKKKPTVKKTDEAAVNALANRVAEIKVSSKITPEQIEEDARQKKIRKLRKSLREIEQIEDKVKSNQNVEKEQLEKVKKKQSIVDELIELGENVD